MKFGSLIFICLMTLSIYAQDTANELDDMMEGHWQGAFIRNNNFQKFDVQFYKSGEQIVSLQIIEEWHPQFGEVVLPVKIDSLGIIMDYLESRTGKTPCTFYAIG